MADPIQSPDPKKMPKKVLIIEDDASMLNILAYKISAEGIKVLQAQDGEAGLALALKEVPDLILLDLLLPKLSGLDLLEKLHKDDRGKQIPVFVLTNLSATSTIYKSVALNTDAYFIKSNSSLDHIATEVKNKLSPPKS
ncbi:MAG TPA: response regulator [Candidatus Saccharimonadales bacterium]|nr:response regulator [Candidatus Saccharimonadales bacterium]